MLSEHQVRADSDLNEVAGLHRQSSGDRYRGGIHQYLMVGGT